MAGRREQLRTELLTSVRDAARAHLRQDGPGGLSLRAIARDVGISPAGLYRYYDGRDALLTMLITDGYLDLADHLFVAQGLDDEVSDLDRAHHVPHAMPPDADVVARLTATWRTYRSWSIEHPNEFHLLFGEPIQGYAAPAGGETVAANARMSMALMRPAVEAVEAGRLRVPRVTDPPASTSVLAEAIAEVSESPTSLPLAALMLSCWSTLHGAVALELNGQFAWMAPGGAADLFEVTMRTVLDGLAVDTDDARRPVRDEAR